MVDERHESEHRQMSGLESSGGQPPGSTQQRAGTGSSMPSTPGSSAMDEARTLADQASMSAETAVDEARNLAGQAGKTASAAADEATDRAYSAVESGRESAASGLERAAQSLEQRATGGEGMPAMAAERAAEGMQSAAGYLREHDTAEIWRDVEQYAQAHPMRSLMGAIAVGFVVGRILR